MELRLRKRREREKRKTTLIMLQAISKGMVRQYLEEEVVNSRSLNLDPF